MKTFPCKFIVAGSLIFASLSITQVAIAGGVLTATLSNGSKITVTAINDNVIKVTNVAPGESVKPSKATVLTAQKFNGSESVNGAVKILTTPTGVKATLDTITGKLDITSGHGRSIIDNGVRALEDGKRVLALKTDGTGSFYGAGERGYHLNLAGDTLVMYNKQNYGYTKGEERIKQMNITMPLFLSSNGYAIVFDDYAAAQMIMGNPVKYVTEGKSPVSFYYVNGGGSLKGVTKELSALTGRQELPPFWALGYTTSKYGYKTEAETRGVIDTLKINKFPVDGIVLDLYWYGKETDMGRLAWDGDQWPTYKKMLQDLKQKGVNVVTISQPYVLRNGRGLDNYKMGAEKGLFVKDSKNPANPQEVQIWVGEGGMWDVSNPETRAWLTQRYKELTLDGVGGWWGDLGEPEVHPETGVHANGLTAREYHNQYGNDWSQIIYDLYKKEFPDTRLMTMMRGGTTGLQRYSVYPWSTDVSRSWGGLQPQVTIMLGSGLSGLGYMSHDVGGFALDEKKPYDPELYVRWVQLGTFSPILRTHSQGNAEPYRYPEQQDILLSFIKERYRWLPYNYTLAYENATEGTPLVRPLSYYEPGSNAYDNISDEYLWGKDVLVAPVLTQGAVSRSVTFPAGKWVAVANPSNVYNGGETVADYPAPLNVLPLFVRAGAIIPTADYEMENTLGYRDNEYTINVYPVAGEKGEFTMFEDDRKSPNSLNDKQYSLITMSDTADAKAITVNVAVDKASPVVPGDKKLTFAINNVTKAPKAVAINGKKISKKEFEFDAAKNCLYVKATWSPKSPLAVTVTR